jgi:uncharacterized protein (TIRG00374 family)
MGFYVLLVLYSDIEKISEEFLKINFTILPLIFASTFVSLMIRSLRQMKFLNEMGVNIPFRENFVLFLSGISMIVTPLGAGALIKAHFLKTHYSQPISKTSPMVLTERYHDLLAVITIISITLFFTFLLEAVILSSIVGMVLAIAYGFVRQRTLLERIQKKLSNIKIINKLIPGLEFNETLSTLTRPKTFVSGWIISIISFLFDGLSVFLVFYAFNVNLEFIEIIQMYFTSIIFGAISFLPAGIGITEASFINLLVSGGLSLSLASTTIIVSRIGTIWFATGIGFISLKFISNTKSNEIT